MNTKTVSKTMVKTMSLSKTTSDKFNISALFTKISDYISKRAKNKKNKYRHIYNDKSIELLTMVNLYSNRYHSLL